MLKLVEPEVQRYYLIEHPDLFTVDVLRKIGLPDIANLDVLARGVVSDAWTDKHTNVRLQLSDLEETLQRTQRELATIGNSLDATIASQL